MTRLTSLAAGVPLLLLAACGGLPEAANGTDFAACADRDCEVRVTDGAKLPHPDLGEVAVTVADEKIQLVASHDDGKGNSGRVSAGGVAGHLLSLNGHRFTVVAVDGAEGVLRVMPD